MTHNQIELKKQQEAERSNRKNEDLKSKEVDVKKGELNFKYHKGMMEQLNKPMDRLTSMFGGIAKLANDKSWYNEDAQLVKDAANISFFNPLGRRFDIPKLNFKPDDVPDSHTLILPDGVETGFYVPGYMAISFITSYGTSEVMTNAARNLYSYVRHANSGHTNYDAPDLFNYIITVDNAYTVFSWLLKTYLAAFKYDSANYYDASARVLACGFNIDDLITVVGLDKIRTRLNLLSLRLNSLNVPSVFPMFIRHQWLALNFFKDTNVRKNQKYTFNPQGWYKYDSESGSMKFEQFRTYSSFGNIFNAEVDALYGYSYNSVLSSLESYVSQLIEDEDIGIMSGDILKAYGESYMYRIASIPTEPISMVDIDSDEVRSQITNATLWGPVQPTNIVQDSVGSIKYETDWKVSIPTDDGAAVFYQTIALNHKDLVLNFYKDEPTPDDIMVATRLSSVASKVVRREDGVSTTPLQYYVIDAVGSEVCTFAHIIAGYYDPINNPFNTWVAIRLFDGAYGERGLEPVNGSLISATALYNLSCLIQSFDWAPRLRLTSRYNSLVDEGSKNVVTISPIYDNIEFENFSTVHASSLRNMHSVAMNSLFAIPAINRRVK